MPAYATEQEVTSTSTAPVATSETATAAVEPAGDRTGFSSKGAIPPVEPDPTPPAAGGGGAAAAPTTLGGILAKEGGSIESISTNKWQLESTAKKLLKAKGIDSPPTSQVEETVFKLSAAIKAGTWESFEAPFSAGALKVEDGVDQRLGNIFFEKQVFTDDELERDKLKLSDNERERLDGGYESGSTGMVLAASFISTRHRAEGDFSRAYGDEAWRGFMRAHTYLQSIPKGQFLEQLDLDLLLEVNRLIHAPDTGLKARVLRFIAMIGRGGRWDRGGELRAGRQFARAERYDATEIASLEQAGVTVTMLAQDETGGGKAMLEYPRPEEVRPGLERIIAELKAELAAPGADPIAAASKFQRHFVALHPFGDSNGRTSRIVMNRILAECDLPPAILADQNRDISVSPEEWRDEVARGVARTKRFLQSRTVESKDEYLGAMGIRAVDKSPNKPITLDGNPFDLGTDGLLYDPTGRPWIAEGDEVIPLAQLEHFVLVRRLTQLGKEGGTARLAEVTAATRALYAKVAADPDAGAGIVVRDDAHARKADAAYELAPQPEVGSMLTELAAVEALDSSAIFQIGGGVGNGTQVSAAISKHAQMDLEYWHLERGLRQGKLTAQADQVRAQRAMLFALARGAVMAGKDPTRVSADNPMGFRFKLEKMMYDTCPLRFESLDAAISADGDRQVTVWRGDYGFARLIGMAPNNDVRQPDAKQVARKRQAMNQLTNLYDDLCKLEGSAIGRQYICTTSDLALLSSTFANSNKSQTVNLSSLPKMVRNYLLAWIEPEKEGMTDEAREAQRKMEVERGDSILRGERGGKEIKDAFGIPGTILTIRMIDKDTAKIEVTAHRKAFQLELDKDGLLPGLYALGGPRFESEQEIHGLERVRPWDIKSVHEAKTLKEEFPVVGATEAKAEDEPTAS
ncbi:MAG: Fic family protein [Kofleriaceae bacterium]